MNINTLDRAYQGALNFANQVRARFGLKPVKRLAKGKPHDPVSCAITNTIAGRSRVRVYTALDEIKAQLPGHNVQIFEPDDPTIDFIVYFDDGAYPELIRR